MLPKIHLCYFCAIASYTEILNFDLKGVELYACTLCMDVVYSLCSQGSHPDAADGGWWLLSTRLHPPVDTHQPPGGAITEQLQ